MPHIVIEYTKQIDETHDMQALCNAAFDALAAHPEVPNPASLKVRTIPAANSRIGTEPQTFAHATLHLLPGRDVATKTDLAQTLLNAMESQLADVGSLTVDVAELSPAYAKRVL